MQKAEGRRWNEEKSGLEARGTGGDAGATPKNRLEAYTTRLEQSDPCLK